MKSGLQVWAVLSLFAINAGGCWFFGGGDKPQAMSTPQAAPLANAEPMAKATVIQKPQVASEEAVETEGDKIAVKPRTVVQPTVVEWPDPDALRLTDASDPLGVTPDEIAPKIRKSAPTSRQAVPEVETKVEEPEGPPAAITTAGANEGLEVPAIAESEPNSPLSVAASDELTKRFAARLRDNPNDLAAHLDYQLLRYLQDEPAPDLNAIAGLPAEDRELVTTLLDGLTNFRNGVRSDNNMLLSKKIRPLLDLAGRLRSQAELSVPTIALCRSVKGFGVYEPIPNRFPAGRANPMIVYCEIENFASQNTDQGFWETKLTQESVLYTEGGQRVWSSRKQNITDLARNRRQDFFSVELLTLPANLTINRYILKVTLVDEQVRRVAEATMPVEIVAQVAPPSAEPAGPAKAPVARTNADPGAEAAVDNK